MIGPTDSSTGYILESEATNPVVMANAQKFEDRKLHTNLENLLEKVISDLFTHLPDEVIPEKELIERGEDGFRSRSKPDYQELMLTYADTWRDYSEYSHCVDAFMGSDLYTEESVFSTLHNTESRNHIHQVVVPRLFDRYFQQKGEIEFDENLFKEVYLEFEEYLNSDTVLFRSWAFLANYEMDSERVELDDRLRIRRVTPQERTAARNRVSMGNLSRFDLMDDFLIEAEFEVSKNPEGAISLDEGQEMFDAVMLALRMFNEGGDVRYKSVFTDMFPVNYSMAGAMSSPGGNHQGVLNEDCELSRKEVENFNSFWNNYQNYFKLKESISISNPLRRFYQMDKKTIVEDAVIDSVIAFESTLLEEIGQTESYRFRMPLRASLLLDEVSERDRDFIYQFFRRLYDARSMIVHRGQEINGIKIGNKEMNANEFTSQAREFLRQTLIEYIKWLAQDQSINQVNQELDEALRNAQYPVRREE